MCVILIWLGKQTQKWVPILLFPKVCYTRFCGQVRLHEFATAALHCVGLCTSPIGQTRNTIHRHLELYFTSK